MIITLLSPDKLTPSMFCDFVSHTYLKNQNVSIKETNNLYDIDYQEKVYKSLEDLRNQVNVLIKYKIKHNTPIESLPNIVFEISDYVLKFDIFSTHPEIIKDNDSAYFKGVCDHWEEAVEKMDKN